MRCPACGHDNPEANKFCGACGASLEPAPARSEVRKTVTIVFCDVVGSTAMGEALDPESLRRVMRRFFDEMRTSIERHGGTVEKFIGDAVMAVFGVPQVHEDDALRATRAAADMRAALRGLNDEFERDHGITLACRIGVNTGEVVAGAGDETIATGDAVNVAARLEQAASAGEILLGEGTYRLVRDAVHAEPIEALDLKGKSDPVAAHRLIDVTSGAAGFSRHLDAPIVGRERELALFRSTFERTVTDHACQLFTVLGVGGVGKSRLVGAVVDELRGGATILRGRCLPYGDGITFYPLSEALIHAADLTDADTPDQARAKLAALAGSGDDAARIAEIVGQVIGIEGSEAAAEETLWAIRTLLERMATARPLVFVIDDLQWAEPRLLELVEHVTDFAQDARILLVCMARPEFLDDHPGWAGGKLNAASILIEPLAPGECEVLVGNLFDGIIDDDIRARVSEAAEGHPLYAEEIAGLLVDEGRVVLKEGRWTTVGDLSDVSVPPTISALLAARLDRLPTQERRLLDTASVMGQVFYPDAVRSLTSDPSHVEQGMSALVRRQFVKPERSDIPNSQALAFRHLLIRDAAYEALPKGVRADLHERFADWLDGTEGTLADHDEIVGYHLEQSYRYRVELGAQGDAERGLADRAGRRLAAAGERAVARSDGSASVDLLSRACALLAPDDPFRLRLLPELGGALAEAGDGAGARAILQEAVERADRAGDRSTRTRAAMGQFWAMAIDWDPEAAAQEALAVFEAAGDERGLSQAWQMLSDIRFGEGRMGDAERAVERALVHARRGNNLREQTDVYSRLGTIFARGAAPITAATRRCREILAQTEGNRTIEAHMFHALAHMLARRGEFEQARDLADRCREIYHDNGAMWAYWAFAEISWDIETLAGRHEEALEILAEGFGHLEEMGTPLMVESAFLAKSLYELGRLDEAERRARVAFDAVDDPWARHTGMGVLATVVARQGHLDQAESLAREAVEHFERTECSIDRTEALLDLAEVLRLAGRPDEAVSTLRHALELFEQREDIVSAAQTSKLIEELTGAT